MKKVLELPMHQGDKVIWNWLKNHEEINAKIVHEGEKLERASLLSHK